METKANRLGCRNSIPSEIWIIGDSHEYRFRLFVANPPQLIHQESDDPGILAPPVVEDRRQRSPVPYTMFQDGFHLISVAEDEVMLWLPEALE